MDDFDEIATELLNCRLRADDSDGILTDLLNCRLLGQPIAEMESPVASRDIIHYYAIALRDAIDDYLVIDDFLKHCQAVPTKMRRDLAFVARRIFEAALWLGNQRLQPLSPLHEQLARAANAEVARKVKTNKRAPRDSAILEAIVAERGGTCASIPS